MATFLLRPRDGGKDIAIPPGKTTIGRGPFLGVTDKRVSRSHAELELTDGKLTVLPLHTNPTFFKASVKEKFVALKKNEAKGLLSGNIISLLPDFLCFEIVNKGSLSKNGLTTEEVDIAKSRPADDPTVVVDTCNHEKPLATSKVPTESFLDEFMDNRPSMEAVPAASTQAIKSGKDPHEFPDSQSQPNVSKKDKITSPKPEVKPAPLLQKTRKLPSWLIQSTSSDTKSPTKKVGNRKGKAPASTTEGKTATPNKAGKTTQKSSPSQQKQKRLDSDDDFVAAEDKHADDGRDELPLRQQGKGKTTLPKKRSSTDLQWDSDDDIAPGRHKKTKKVLSESDDEDEPLQSTKKKEVVKPVLPVLKDESSGSDEDVKPASTKKSADRKTPEKDESTTSKLPPCPYGNKCYRKNPVHFKEYSHTDKDSKADDDDDGDDDDDDEALGDGSDDRPECPYGTSCYRKNPQHKRDFKHNKAPECPKRKRSKHKSVLDDASDDEGGPNTYDYNDSFLDDGDSDGSYSAGSDDSDWQPQGGDDDDDDDDEDVNELLTEARGFLRSKNMTKPV